jgi:hypothetical protein
MVMNVAAQRFAAAISEVRAAAIELATIEAMMNTKSLDQPGSGQTTVGDVGADTARHRAEKAAQDTTVNNLADRVRAAASGSVPAPIKKGQG